jgi:hypothetical protein
MLTSKPTIDAPITINTSQLEQILSTVGVRHRYHIRAANLAVADKWKKSLSPRLQESLERVSFYKSQMSNDYILLVDEAAEQRYKVLIPKFELNTTKAILGNMR